jgi:glutathione peroxidase
VARPTFHFILYTFYFQQVNTIHTFKVEGIAGKTLDFAALAGKKILVVNVASECGLTPQYQQLQELYEEFEDKLTIVGFPANNFGGQEPGSNEQIQTFCARNYGVSFPLAAKVDVTTHPVYQWLTQKALNGVQDSEVTWNFQKYALDEQGRLVHVFPPTASPLDERVIEWLSE